MVWRASITAPDLQSLIYFFGITQFSPFLLRNVSHSWRVILQCIKRWVTVSAFSSQKKHLGLGCIPLFMRFSWVKTVYLATSQARNFIRNFDFPYKLPRPVLNLIITRVKFFIGPFHTETTLTMALPLQSILVSEGSFELLQFAVELN